MLGFSKTNKGFTIIELIVVIAIIAILAAVVMVNVTGYINKSKIATMKFNMSTLNIAATEYIKTNGNYSSFCSDPAVLNVSSAIAKILAGSSSSGTGCASENVSNFTMDCTSSQWIYVSFLLKNADGLLCIDSTGVLTEVPSLDSLGACKCSNS